MLQPHSPDESLAGASNLEQEASNAEHEQEELKSSVKREGDDVARLDGAIRLEAIDSQVKGELAAGCLVRAVACTQRHNKPRSEKEHEFPRGDLTLVLPACRGNSALRMHSQPFIDSSVLSNLFDEDRVPLTHSYNQVFSALAASLSPASISLPVVISECSNI